MVVQIGGTGASSRINKYRKSARGSVVTRSLASLLELAASHGVQIPSYADVRLVPVEFRFMRHDPENGKIVLSQYFSYRAVLPDEPIYWHQPTVPDAVSIVDPECGRVVIYMRSGLMNNQEGFIHHLAHEVYELRHLKAAFDEAGGYLSATEVDSLTNPYSGGPNLHHRAWDYADELIERMRKEKP